MTLQWFTQRDGNLNATRMHVKCDGCGWFANWDPTYPATEAGFIAWANTHTPHTACDHEWDLADGCEQCGDDHCLVECRECGEQDRACHD